MTETRVIHITGQAYTDAIKVYCWMQMAPTRVDMPFNAIEDHIVRHILENLEDELLDTDGNIIDSSDFFIDVNFNDGKLILTDFNSQDYLVTTGPF